MNPLDIEEWAYRIVSRAEKGQPLEDDLVELKANFPEPREVARQLGGHANVARGEPILWLLGVDQSKGVVDCQLRDMAAWRPALEAEFEGGAPAMQHLTLAWNGKMFVALVFATDTAPYVVRNPKRNEPASGPFEFEVPWRDGRTRSARRAELILMLRPISRLPSVEPIGGHARLSRDGTLQFNIHFYVASEKLERIVISRSVGSINLGPVTLPLTGFNVHPDGNDPDVTATRSHLNINGAGKISCNGSVSASLSPEFAPTATFEVRLHIPAAGRDALGRAVLNRYPPDSQDAYAVWKVPAELGG